MKRIVLSVTIKVRSPFLFPDTAAGAFGLDRIALRNAAGKPIISQDQIRGVLFHACADAASAMQKKRDLRLKIFGAGSADARRDDPNHRAAAAEFEPVRGRVLFADLVADVTGSGQRSVRVAIDPETGAADDGKLMFAELVAPPGAIVTFAGEAVLLANDADAKDWVDLLQAAASWVSAIGAMKSAGFGEVDTFSIKQKSESLLAAKPIATVQDRQGYKLSFDRRIAVDVRRVADNVYVGQDIVPGAVIKGALARKLELCGQLQGLEKAVSALSISHARLTDAGPAIPLSMVVAGSNTVGDALLVPNGKGALIDGMAASWRSDWKFEAETAVRAALGLPASEPAQRSVRTHVAIDEDTGVAADQKLFAIDAVEPLGRFWSCVIDYSAITEPSERQKLAGALEAELDGIGRTGATVRLERTATADLPPVLPIDGTADLFAVVLETDAVMANPSDGKDAFDAYKAWWRLVLPSAEFVNFFASQRLAGGYISRRYAPAQDYQPFWLTEAGSVFILRGNIASKLSELTRTRLPAPVIGGITTTWRTCPYQPENGYGEIRCNHVGALASQVTYG